jgi:ribosomal-protein-serine acetyltransferase
MNALPSHVAINAPTRQLGVKHPALLDLPERLETKRLVLRPFAAGDGANVFASINENRELVRNFMPWIDAHDTVEASEAYARRMHSAWLSRTGITLAVFEKATDTYLGGIGPYNINWEIPSMELGYYFRLSAWGKGFAAEACGAICDLCFDHAQCVRLYAWIHGDNAQSVRVMEKAGFVREGVLRLNSRDHHGKNHDAIMYSMLREDFLTSKINHNE